MGEQAPGVPQWRGIDSCVRKPARPNFSIYSMAGVADQAVAKTGPWKKRRGWPTQRHRRGRVNRLGRAYASLRSGIRHVRAGRALPAISVGVQKRGLRGQNLRATGYISRLAYINREEAGEKISRIRHANGMSNRAYVSTHELSLKRRVYGPSALHRQLRLLRAAPTLVIDSWKERSAPT